MNVDTEFLVDEFTGVQDGKVRLFKFGNVVKNGKVRKVDADLARQFSLPHFQPAFKLGSHEQTTPSGGSIVGLEVVETGNPETDGLYGLIDWNTKGKEAIDEKAFKYHSPEVIWPGGAYENPDTGEPIPGPLIIGAALTHTPHLGHTTALFSAEPKEEKQTNKEENKMSETPVIDQATIDKFSAWLDKQGDEEGKAAVKELTAVAAERDNLKAEVKDMKTNNEKAERFSAIKTELETDKFGAAYQAYSTEEESVERLAGMSDEDRAWVLGELKKLSSQVDETNLTEEQGVDGDGIDESVDPAGAFNAHVKQIQSDDETGKTSYKDAYEIAKTKHADLFNSAYNITERGQK